MTLRNEWQAWGVDDAFKGTTWPKSAGAQLWSTVERSRAAEKQIGPIWQFSWKSQIVKHACNPALRSLRQEWLPWRSGPLGLFCVDQAQRGYIEKLCLNDKKESSQGRREVGVKCTWRASLYLHLHTVPLLLEKEFPSNPTEWPSTN